MGVCILPRLEKTMAPKPPRHLEWSEKLGLALLGMSEEKIT